MKLSANYTQESIIAGIKSGDEAMMEYVYREYYPMVAHFIIKNSGNETDAQDLYQEGLLIVFRKLKEGTEVQYLKTYIYSVCRNKWLAQLRYRRMHAEKIVDSLEFFEVWVEEESEATPYEMAMQQALEALDETCRKLLLAFYFEKQTMDDIAVRFGYNQANTAKSKKNKCMEKIREKAKAILVGL
jgi:RNA polymerase sigma factor (sigma-70 family)